MVDEILAVKVPAFDRLLDAIDESLGCLLNCECGIAIA